MTAFPLFSRRVAMASMAALAVAGCDRKIQPVTAAEMSKGDPKAPVTMVEYASVTCSHCADFNARLMPQIEAKYIRTGQVYYVYREFITAPHALSAQGILLARCAGRDKYFKVIDAIMASQDEMYADDGVNAQKVLQDIAAQVGLDEKAFKACVTNTQAITDLQARVDTYAKTDHIDGTPTFFINGKLLRRHTGELDEFDKAITEAHKEALKKAGK